MSWNRIRQIHTKWSEYLIRPFLISVHCTPCKLFESKLVLTVRQSTKNRYTHITECFLLLLWLFVLFEIVHWLFFCCSVLQEYLFIFIFTGTNKKMNCCSWWSYLTKELSKGKPKLSSIFVCMRRVFGFIRISSIVNGLLFDSGLNVPKELRTHPLIISRISYFWFIKFIICLCVCGYLCLFTNDRNLNIYIHFLFVLYYYYFLYGFIQHFQFTFDRKY